MKKSHIFFRIFFTLVLDFLLLPLFSNAQNGFILHGFRDVQQSSFLNPAFTSGATVVVGFPLFSNFSIGLIAPEGGLNNFIPKNTNSDSLSFHLNKLINNNMPVYRVAGFMDMDILFVGFKAGSSFISVGVRQRDFVQAILDRDLLKLIANGNSQYVNQMLDLSKTTVKGYQLMDYHLGISIPVGNKFRVGVRFHVLQGLSGITTKNNGVKLKTVKNSHGDLETHGSGDFWINTSIPLDLYNSNLGNYLSNFANLGFSVDLGVDVQVTKQIWVNASILNCGKVYYRSNTKNYNSETSHIHFNEDDIDLNSSNNTSGSNGDTLKETFNVSEESRNYTIKLPARIIVGGEYYTKDMRNDFSFLFSGRFFENYFDPAFSFGYSRFVSRHFSVKANYTLLKDDPVNFGLAMAVYFFPFQFYLYSDNVPGIFQWEKQKYVQAGFGLNIRIAPRNTRKSPHNHDIIHNLRPDIVR